MPNNTWGVIPNAFLAAKMVALYGSYDDICSVVKCLIKLLNRLFFFITLLSVLLLILGVVVRL